MPVSVEVLVVSVWAAVVSLVCQVASHRMPVVLVVVEELLVEVVVVLLVSKFGVVSVNPYETRRS